MMLAVRVALALAVIGVPLAMADDAPRVTLATPGLGNGAIQRFTLRFSAAMVPLGDPRAAAPAAIACPVGGEGRWVDPQTWVYDFASGLPGGVTCRFDLRDGLKSAAGYAVEGTRSFSVDSGGPVARAVLPGGYGGEIEEDQVFLVAANLPASPGSVGANAYCAIDGLSERIPVDVLGTDAAIDLLKKLGKDDWQSRSFLSSAGLPETVPASADEAKRALAGVTALRCRRPLPPGRDMALVWGAGIESGGRTAGADQRFDFTVRKPFTARFECSRVNPQAGCNPVSPGWLRFSAPVPAEVAKQARIEVPGGKVLTAAITDDDKNKAMVSEVRFTAPLPEAVAAKLVLPAGVKDESGRTLSNAERFPLEVRFDEAPPLVKFAAPFGIVEAKEGGTLPVTIRNVENPLPGSNAALAGQALRVAGSDASVAKWLRTIDEADDYKSHEEQRGGETVTVNDTGSKPILTGGAGKTFNLPLPAGGKPMEVVPIALGKPGFYVVEFASPRLGAALLGRNAPRYVAAGALVTNMAVHFKWGRGGSLAWVTALDSGKPVAGAEVRVTDSCTGAELARGRSDAQGRAAFAKGLPEPETYTDCGPSSEAHPLMISARAGDDMSFTLTQWGEGIRPYDFDLPFGWSAREEVIHTVFDRALVKQGETVNMKHFVRMPSPRGFSLMPGFTGKLVLSHSGSGTEFELPLTIRPGGSGETTWAVPAAAPMGDYSLRFVNGDRTIWSGQSVKVDEYRLPTMKASVSGPSAPMVKPKSVPLDLFAGYLSGGGASNLAVDLRVAFMEGVRQPKGYDGYSFAGRRMVEGVKPLNGDGEEELSPLPPTQTLPLTLNGEGTARTSVDVPATLSGPTDLLVEMDYEDANGEILTASRRVPLYDSAIQIGVKTDGWMMKDDDLRLKLVALDPTGKPIKGQRIKVELFSREVLTARRRLIGGFYAYDNQMKTTRINESCSATTDELGLAECRMDPGVSGEVYAVATAEDADGNAAVAGTSVWLAGEDDWWFGGDNGDRMDVIAEAPEVKAGDKARFQVRMPFREAMALVTVEREGVIDSFVTELSGKDPVVEVAMPGGYAPEVYVSVMAVRGRIGGWSLWLANLAREWNLPFFSREGARPTALVDLAKPAYRMGVARVKVGWDDFRMGVAVKADKERYAARDTAQVAIAVTNPDGSPARDADVAFVAVDEALLQLAPNESWDVLTAMMGDRPLSVLTSTAQMQVVGKRHYGRKAVEAGGGGGGDLSGLNRENFQPVLLWRGQVALDAQGRAQVAVPLSDALSGFRLVAVAGAADGNAFGMGEASVRTAQDLSIFAGVPPLVRGGDRYAAQFTLRNGSDRAMKVTADVTVSPRVATGRPISVTIPAGGAVPVAWNLTAPGGTGTLTWTVNARSEDGRAVDRMTVVQNVVPPVPVETWAATLVRVGAGGDIPIAPPGGFLPGLGAVEVTLTDTLVPPMQGVRDYMAAYPYTCFEQRLSRAVALGDVAAWNRLAGEMPAYLDADGLLKYFPVEGMNGSEALTAYVLSITAEAGLPLPGGSRDRMIAAMQAVLDGRLRREEYGDVRIQRIAALAALARAGAANAAMLGQIGMTPAEMPTATLADYLSALGRISGLANGAALRAAGEGELRKRLAYEGTRLDLTDQGQAAWWMMSSGDEAAIKALAAVLGRPGWDGDGPRMMTGIATRQQRGHWDTTTANAWGTILARRFASAYPAEAVAGVTTASLGTARISRGWPLTASSRLLSFPLPAARTPLSLTQGGGAGPWAFVRVKAAVPLTRPLAAGYRMTRKVDVVQARTKGVLTRGDVLRVTLTIEASAERSWVAVTDPVPAGATVIGGMANQSAMLDEGGTSEGAAPSYVERGQDAWRAYFAWLPAGTHTVSYTVRLNGAGTLQLPPSRVEAMYSPEIRAAVPNRPVVVKQR